MNELTVVIPNYGTPEYTIRAAEALMADGAAPEQIVVVENGSGDDSYERFEQELRECVLVGLPENVGFARAANAGAARRPAEAYLFVNSDAFLHAPGSLARLLAALERPDVGVAVPRLLNEDLTLQRKVAPLYSPAVAIVRASGLSRLVPNRWQPSWSMHWDHSYSREIQAASGVVLLVRGEAWSALGGFAETALMYTEDLDLCWRTRKLGWKVWFVHDAEFVHIGEAATRKHWDSARRAELIGQAEAAMIRRHLGRVGAALTIGFITSGLAARLAYYTAVRNSNATAALRGSLRGYLR